MKKILVKIIYAFCLVSFVLLILIIFTVAHSRIVRDKQYIYSTLTDLEDTIEKMEQLKSETSIIVDEGLEDIIRDIFETFSSAQYTIYATVMKDDGETVALSKNNVQKFVVNNGLEGEEYLELLHSIANGEKSFVRINGSVRLAQALEGEEYFIVAYKDNSDLIKMLINETIIVLAFIVICSSIIMLVCYEMMKKYIFDDLELICREIQEFLQGNCEVEFQNSRIDELNPLVEAMERFRRVFLHKSERMDRILDVISPDIGVFECLNEIEMNFYSHSLWEILGLDQQEKEKILNSSRDFKQFINSISRDKNESNIIVYQNKHLEVYTYDVEGDYVGVVVDRTKEENEKIDLLHSLEREQEKSLHDALTGVRNREGFEKEVKRLLGNNNEEGTLLICDLDNFKGINDSLGHPEGDKVLKIFSSCIKRQFRRSDILGRLGGDEFVVFIPNKIETTALKKKLDVVMADVNCAFGDYCEYGIGVSIGVSMVRSGITNYQSLYEEADSALYVAKQMGKNQYFINFEGVRCMNKSCLHCREKCPRRDALIEARKLI